MNLHSSLALDIKNSKLIIIDEATMMTKHALRCIDRLLKDIMKNSHPFGGNVILLGGDFRQTLPVVPKGSKVDIIESCIKSSYLWSHFKIIHLIDNMRISSNQVDYNAWLLKIGDGLSRSNSDLPTNSVEIPPYLIENDSLIKCVYGNYIEIADIDSLSTKIILTTKNKIALTLNNDIINIISGPIKHYYSADSIESDNKDDIMNFPLEFLHSQTPSDMPPHKLTLKVGTIVMLLRNLSPKKGLCNGTRLIIRHLHINFIDAEVLTGTNKGYRVFLPRIDLAPSDSQLPFTLKRRQFPIIPAFVITINKSQGQTFDHVGLFLPEPVFAHGQLYVALTRCKSQNNMKIMILPSELQGKILKMIKHSHKISYIMKS
ncbi:ATP-dependent DNA helicase PIF1-like [Gordionus sp. m RMFG-2023]|uniref:ATP-dependent DNA helicase PIF1-like n=1 Tax=Gordionus sp. m RMFG-2023 TaxID=3053472 RepID=UPI0031FD9D2C